MRMDHRTNIGASIVDREMQCQFTGRATNGRHRAVEKDDVRWSEGIQPGAGSGHDEAMVGPDAEIAGLRAHQAAGGQSPAYRGELPAEFVM